MELLRSSPQRARLHRSHAFDCSNLSLNNENRKSKSSFGFHGPSVEIRKIAESLRSSPQRARLHRSLAFDGSNLSLNNENRKSKSSFGFNGPSVEIRKIAESLRSSPQRAWLHRSHAFDCSNLSLNNENRKSKSSFGFHGPSVEIRTRGLLNPIQARYQTSPHPDASVDCPDILAYCFQKSKYFFVIFKSFSILPLHTNLPFHTKAGAERAVTALNVTVRRIGRFRHPE